MRWATPNPSPKPTSTTATMTAAFCLPPSDCAMLRVRVTGAFAPQLADRVVAEGCQHGLTLGGKQIVDERLGGFAIGARQGDRRILTLIIVLGHYPLPDRLVVPVQSYQ